jgi:hypothetical protein
MSPAGHALQARFDDVCRSELRRLHRKTASLAPEHRADVHALTLEVAERIAVRLDGALTSIGGGDVESIVMRLFAVTARNVQDR